jgi:putative oxidoreductase
MMVPYNQIIAALLLRLFLGILFFAQGYDKIFNVTNTSVIQTFETKINTTWMPRVFLVILVYLTSYIEFVGGFLLILGLAKYYVLYFLGLDLILVSIAFSMIDPVWDLQHVFRRMVMLLTALVIPYEWDLISLDYIFQLF